MGLFDKMKEKAQDAVISQTENLKSKEVAGKNIGELVKPIEATANKIISNKNEAKKEQLLTVQVKKVLSKQFQPLNIRKDVSGYYYISNKFDPNSPRFTFERISWNGSTFTQETLTKGEINTHGRAGSALVGGMIAGPAGAIIGGARKRKSKVDTKSTTTTKENGSEAIIYLRSLEDNSIKEIKTEFTTAMMSNAQSFFTKENNLVFNEKSNSEQSNVEQVKDLKELLDMGIISQEEFDVKKKELLNL